MDQFRTDRMIVERLSPAHFDQLVALHLDPIVMETLGGVRSPESTKDYLNTNLQHWDDYGFGLWIFYDHKRTFIGRGGLRHIDADDRDEIEIAYALPRSYWGQGLATEMALLCQKVGFEHLAFDELMAVTLPENIASRRVMEKIGMGYIKNVVYKESDCALYRQSWDAYLMRT